MSQQANELVPTLDGKASLPKGILSWSYMPAEPVIYLRPISPQDIEILQEEWLGETWTQVLRHLTTGRPGSVAFWLKPVPMRTTEGNIREYQLGLYTSTARKRPGLHFIIHSGTPPIITPYTLESLHQAVHLHDNLLASIHHYVSYPVYTHVAERRIRLRYAPTDASLRLELAQ